MTFILSKIAWMFLAPGNFLTLLLLAGAFLALSHREGWRDLGRRLCFDVAFLLFFIAIFPVGDWMLMPLENRYPAVKPVTVDGIIVLGGDENPRISEARGQPALYGSAQRYIEFAALARAYPQAQLIYSGGSPLLKENSKLNQADVARETLTSIGVPQERMIYESHSRNTHDNAVYTAALVHPKPDQRWLLVTSAYHMPRAIGTFKKAGWNVFPAPTDYHTTGVLSSELNFNFSAHLLEMSAAAHEYYGLIAYYLMGYTNSPWP